MSLRDGAETIVEQCMKIGSNETVLVLNDGNDQDLIDALVEVADENASEVKLMEYEEPENHGEEPPEEVADAMKQFDAVIAPTKKSISHTSARVEACESGSRVATLPGITREIWNSSLQADYSRVKELSDKVYSMLEDTDKVRVETPSGTDVTFKVDIEYYHRDTGLIQEPGDFGNLPAGEADGGMLELNGTLVVDHFPFAPSGTEIEVEANKIVAVRHPGDEESELAKRCEEMECVKQAAEFGFGTNPKATLIGNILQDEKVFGTVHIAFGDNTSYLPEDHPGHNPCGVHWDTVCEKPTAWFDDRKVLDEGEPTFLDE